MHYLLPILIIFLCIMFIEWIDRCFKPKKSYSKKSIPLALKRSLWDRDIGLEIGKVKCPICRQTDIYQSSFHACHIVPEKLGGETSLSNLKIACGGCNLSMGQTNYDLFKKKFD